MLFRAIWNISALIFYATHKGWHSDKVFWVDVVKFSLPLFLDIIPISVVLFFHYQNFKSSFEPVSRKSTTVEDKQSSRSKKSEFLRLSILDSDSFINRKEAELDDESARHSHAFDSESSGAVGVAVMKYSFVGR